MKYLILIVLLYFTDVLAFSGSTALLIICHYLIFGLSIGSFIYYAITRKWSRVTFFIFLYAIIYPVYASIKSQILFGQPFYMGVASLRYLDYILFGYFLVLIKYDYRLLLKQINIVNLSIAIVSTILILILGIDPSKISSLMASTNTLNIVGPDDSTTDTIHQVRGVRFSACSMLMFISYIYYQLACLIKGGRKNWIIFSVFIIFLLFVNKGRQPIAVMGVIYLIYFLKLKGLSAKRIAMILIPICLILVLIAFDDTILSRFTTILEGENSKDFSTLARIWSVEKISPLIFENPILGVGNLSSRFGNGGFQTFFWKTILHFRHRNCWFHCYRRNSFNPYICRFISEFMEPYKTN